MSENKTVQPDPPPWKDIKPALLAWFRKHLAGPAGVLLAAVASFFAGWHTALADIHFEQRWAG